MGSVGKPFPVFLSGAVGCVANFGLESPPSPPLPGAGWILRAQDEVTEPEDGQPVGGGGRGRGSPALLSQLLG